MIGRTNAIKLNNGGTPDIPTGPAIDLSMRNAFGMELESRCTANCYIVREAGTYKLPLVYGNAILHGEANPISYAQTFGSFVNWRNNPIESPYIEEDAAHPEYVEISKVDYEGLISDVEIIDGEPCRFLQFKLNVIPTTGANAVLSILDHNSEVLWSWHIWVMCESLRLVGIYSSTGFFYTVLSQNLGQTYNPTDHMYGCCYYQWGRHIPFLTYNSINDLTEKNYGVRPLTVSPVAVKYCESILEPGYMFTTTDTRTQTWCIASLGVGLWNATCGDYGSSDDIPYKTVYDPCPFGFVVPNGQVFTELSDSRLIGDMYPNLDFDFEGNILSLPLTGLYRNNGVLSYNTSQACLWTFASFDGYSAFAVNAASAGGRVSRMTKAAGMPIRPMIDANALQI